MRQTHGNDGIKPWERLLIADFKQATNTALKQLTKGRYTEKDGLEVKYIRSFAGSVTRLVKGADLDKVQQQLSYVYNNLEPELRTHMYRPIENTTILQSMKDLFEKQECWAENLEKARRKNQLRSSAASTTMKARKITFGQRNQRKK